LANRLRFSLRQQAQLASDVLTCLVAAPNRVAVAADLA
jgi:hypothetical protein